MNKEIVLDKYGKKELIGHIIGPVIISLIFFLLAGTINLYRAWIWSLLTLIYYITGMLVVLNMNPVLLNERGNWNKKKDVKKWDKVILQIFGTVGLYGHTTIMALDVGRFGWSEMETWTLIPGIILYTISFLIVYLAMSINPHFETIVRIQHERNHKVISNGPYRFIRHPGYAGLILSNFASAMIIGSAFGLISASATLIILCVRTYLEDRTLREELEGYSDYSQRVRYKLLPFIW
jgi:protein-S-isoprenylcysteine O-methyltransferase Ste14